MEKVTDPGSWWDKTFVFLELIVWQNTQKAWIEWHLKDHEH